MTKMVHAVTIDRPIDEVLAYAASAGRWPEWHPSSLRVQGPKGPLPTGARFEEDIRAGGRAGHLSWEVVEYAPSLRWVARAEGTNGVSLHLTYEVSEGGEGTRFVRTLEYTLAGVFMRIANALVLRRRIDRESEESLCILKRVVEALPESERERLSA